MEIENYFSLTKYTRNTCPLIGRADALFTQTQSRISSENSKIPNACEGLRISTNALRARTRKRMQIGIINLREGEVEAMSPYPVRKRTWKIFLILSPLILAAGAMAFVALKPTKKGQRQHFVSPKYGVGATLEGKKIFPVDNPWNRDISKDPKDPLSNVLIASIGADKPLHPDFGTTYENRPIGIPYMVIDGEQSKKRFPTEFEYKDESDPGPYPVPLDAPIEGGSKGEGDRHVLVVDKEHWKLYELFSATPSGKGWKAGSGAIFDLNSNKLRPAGWTSADAAGLPIFPGLVRYDEVCERKEINHALRFTVQKSRRAYVPPATHYASKRTNASYPPMGMRVRLKASVDISGFPANDQVILRALKKYGMIMADNGSDWFLSGSHDMRWNDEELGALKKIKGNDFEVVKMEGIVVGE